MSGITRTTQHHFKYNVSKGAAIHLSNLLAQECRRTKVNVRVNNIAPGIFPSEMTSAFQSPCCFIMRGRALMEFGGI